MKQIKKDVGTYNWHYPGVKDATITYNFNFLSLDIRNRRVPTAPGKLGKPGKMTTVFPVLEKYWNFIILLKILEKWE